MKLAYVHSGKWPSDSPSTTFVTYNSLGLAENTEKCHLFIKKNSRKKPGKVFRDLFNIKKCNNLAVHQLKKPFINTNYFYYRKVLKMLAGIIKTEGLNAVITRRETFLPYLIKLKNKYNIKIYYETHDFYADLSLRNDINTVKKKKQSRLERKYIPHMDGLICLQKHQEKLYAELFPGVDIKVFKTGILRYVKSDRERKYTTYIGSLDRLKGVETLLKAATLCNNKPKLLIIGGKSRKQIRGLKKLVGNKFRDLDVTITGWLNKKKMDQLLKQTQIGIIPLRDTFFNRYITSPLKLFDYLSYGIPVISSDLPATRFLIDQNRSGLFFKAQRPRALAEKIDILLSDNLKIKEMRTYILNNTSHLLWRNRGKNIVQWIKKSGR